MKGQWFIVSAALIAIAFFSISLILKNHTIVNIEPLDVKEDFYFRDLSYAAEQAGDFQTFKTFAEAEMAKRSYYVKIEPGSVLIASNIMKIKG